uniref:F-box domain-containing protein n=1 Tax=Setaria italica TaxID=4555 RepID=K3Y2L1_SETIT
MAGAEPPRHVSRRPPRRRRGPSHDDTTTIDSLGEIFLRLPTLATLVRAALTRRAWRRAPQPDALPAFESAQRRDRDVHAAIRGGDFALTSLLDPEDYARDLPLPGASTTAATATSS